MGDTEEKRAFTRINWQSKATVSLPDREVQAECLDISLNGALLRSEEPPEPGTACEFQLPLGEPPDEAIEAEGTVVRQTEDTFAVQFQALELDSAAHLRNMVAYNSGDPGQIDREVSNLREVSRGPAED